MSAAHQHILIGGALMLAAILAGLLGSRAKTPLLLIFLGLGMFVGEDGPGGILFDDFRLTYLLGSIALMVILFEGGLKTSAAMLRVAAWPALALATAGTAITAGIVGAVVVGVAGVDWARGLLLGAMMAPTDAAAVSSVLRASRLELPPRVDAVLEVESGLNDPMSVFLTLLFVELLLAGQVGGHGQGHVDVGQVAVAFLREMLGGALFGLAGGAAMAWAMRRIKMPETIYPVLLLAAACTLFGAAQVLECSGFLAIYLAGVIVATRAGARVQAMTRVFEAFGWIAQIGLFLMLGLLITPHDMVPLAVSATSVALALMLVARPLSVLICLRPFGFGWGESGFIGWVGLRGAVPIYLAIIPVLSGVPHGELGFAAAFLIVLVSLVVQGWTVGPAARLFGLVSSGASTRSGGPGPGHG
jgi:cell volume regulation protein A